MSALSQPAPSFDPRRPFTRAEARTAGITPDALLSGPYVKICFDTYVAREVQVTTQVKAQAALRLVPAGSRVSHGTAAELWGAPVPSDAAVHLSLPSAKKRVVRRGVRCHYGGPGGRASRRHGLPVSSPEQTFLELAAAGMGLVDLVVVLDALVKAEHTTVDRLITAAAGWAGRGCRVARRAASLTREGVDSPRESRLRLLLVLAGLPEPTTNVIVRHADGSWKRRFDLAYESVKLLVEYDGRQHSGDPTQWLADIHRREELDRMRWRIIVVTSEGLFEEPLRTLERVRDALVELGHTGVRRTFAPEWRLHFPGR